MLPAIFALALVLGGCAFIVTVMTIGFRAHKHQRRADRLEAANVARLRRRLRLRI